MPFAWEFPDPETFARALASTGPANEAIQTVGETAFAKAAIDRARQLVRDGLPLRAQIDMAGYLAASRFLCVQVPSAEAQHIFDEDVAELGFVMNASWLWACQPDADTASSVLRGKGLIISERAMAGWARRVARDPNNTAGLAPGRGTDAIAPPGAGSARRHEQATHLPHSRATAPAPRRVPAHRPASTAAWYPVPGRAHAASLHRLGSRPAPGSMAGRQAGSPAGLVAVAALDRQHGAPEADLCESSRSRPRGDGAHRSASSAEVPLVWSARDDHGWGGDVSTRLAIVARLWTQRSEGYPSLAAAGAGDNRFRGTT